VSRSPSVPGGSEARDLRVCFVGDSFVAGVGDSEKLGWVGRVASRSDRAGQTVSVYNLGVRLQTSSQVLARWQAECAQRLPDGCDNRVVVSFGVNDTTWTGSASRVEPETSAANLASMLDDVLAAGWGTLVVGPLPISDPDHNLRTAMLDDAFARVCRDAGVEYVRVFEDLLGDETWMRQVEEGDGAHPAAQGYRRLADLVWPRWHAWILSP